MTTEWALTVPGASDGRMEASQCHGKWRQNSADRAARWSSHSSRSSDALMVPTGKPEQKVVTRFLRSVHREEEREGKK